MLIPQYLVLVLKLSPIYTVSPNTVFSITQNQCYPGTPLPIFFMIMISIKNFQAILRLTANFVNKMAMVKISLNGMS